MKKYLKISFAVALFIALIVILYMFRKSPDSLRNTKPDYILDPLVLVDEFNKNENTANQKYLDKVIQVEGIIIDIDKSFDEKTTIYIEGSIFGNVSCLIANDQLKGINLELGNSIAVKGKCTGYILDVVLTKCSLLGNQ